MSLFEYIKAAATNELPLILLYTVKAEQEEAITHFALGEMHCPPDMERVSATKLFRRIFDCFGKGREEVNSDGS